MSFKAVWGFDPDEVLREQKSIHKAQDRSVHQWEETPDWDDSIEIPRGSDVQVEELRRMFSS